MVNGFTKKRVGTMTLGEKLRKLRSDRRISLNEVSRVTRIQVAYLECLENGEYEKLPVDVYVKGFLKSYADFLGVEEQILIKLYDKEKGIKKNLEASRNPQKEKLKIEPINISSFVFTPRKIFIGGIIFLVISIFAYLYREIGSFAHTPRLIVFSPQANAEVDGNSVLVEGVTDKDARLFINEQPILVNDDGKFTENLTLQSGVNTISVKSVNKFDKEAVEIVNIQSKYNQQIAGDMTENEEENLRKIEEEKGEEIELELRVDPGPVWLSVEADGNLVFSGKMLTGATQVFRAQKKIVIDSGKAEATFVKLNGQERGPLTTEPGAARGVTFTNDNN